MQHMINIRFPAEFINWSLKPEVIDRMPEHATYDLVWDADRADGTFRFRVELDDTNLTKEQVEQVYHLLRDGIPRSS